MHNRYTKAFKRMYESLSPISQRYNRPKIFFLADALLGYIRYGITPNEYIGWEFYKRSSLDRKRYFTNRDQNRYETQFNDPAASDSFNHKDKTNVVFSRFVKRDWILTTGKTEREIADFLELHPKCIVKPLNLSSGRGILTISHSKGENLNTLYEKISNSKIGGVNLSISIIY